MDVAGLSEERGARPVAGYRSNGARDRRGFRPRGSAVRPVAMGQAAIGGDQTAAAADTADHRQADYFLRLLAQSRRLVDHRIGQYHKVIAQAEADGDAEAACGFRRMARVEEQDRQTLDGLIENLHRRFALRPSAGVPPRRARSVVR
ncbi:hypothetical protein BST29_13610 [Mycobacterium malmoense]|uniref:Uncharacterized protein n=1 Tax=Mycobacterium malmoense TaxID=1780 RepID=A0ABX3SQS8_MYCMA|nr:hypothetical protein BMG05_26205 [Mycobacterium malmoense]ORA81741.1 hypothetical protein BST29_13610 [Mycobacterium malmoense]